MGQAVSCPPRPEDFDMALGLFAGEFHALKCPIPTNKRLHFVEVGIGGEGSQVLTESHIFRHCTRRMPLARLILEARTPPRRILVKVLSSACCGQDIISLSVIFYQNTGVVIR